MNKLNDALKVGDENNGNYTEIREDGTIRVFGSGTAWKDIVMDIFSKTLNGTTGKVDYDWDNNAIKFQSGGDINNPIDRVQGNQEINHELKVGEDIMFRPHIHWFQQIVNGYSTGFIITLRWRLQRNGFPMETEWNEIEIPVGDPYILGSDEIYNFEGVPDGFYNQITRFPDIEISCNISDTFQFQIARTDSWGGDMLVYFFDLHAEVDSLGSDDEINKVY